MKVADRYILREFLLLLLASLGIVTAFFVTERMFELTDLVLNRGIRVAVVFQLVLCLIPSIIAVALPIATLVATIWVFGRMAYDREMLAFKGAGVSLERLVVPVAITGAVFSVALVLFNGSALPASTAAYKNLFIAIIRQRATVAFQERVFVREFDGYLLYFDRKEEPGGVLRDVYVVESPPRPPRVIAAELGRLQVDPGGFVVQLVLEKGTVDQPADRLGEHYTRIEFNHYEVNLDIHQALTGGKFLVKSMDEMDYGDLAEKISEFRDSPEERRPFEVVLHQRLALAFAPLFVVFIGAPLGALVRRGGGPAAGIAIFVVCAYYSMLTLGRGIADRGDFPVWLAFWVPNLFLGTVGAASFWAVGREARLLRWGR